MIKANDYTVIGRVSKVLVRFLEMLGLIAAQANIFISGVTPATPQFVMLLWPANPDYCFYLAQNGVKPSGPVLRQPHPSCFRSLLIATRTATTASVAT